VLKEEYGRFVMDEFLLNAIRNEVIDHLKDESMRIDSFKNFCDDFDIINSYEDGYRDGKYKKYLKVIFDEIKMRIS